jgi:hypothetical protein
MRIIVPTAMAASLKIGKPLVQLWMTVNVMVVGVFLARVKVLVYYAVTTYIQNDSMVFSRLLVALLQVVWEVFGKSHPVL